MEDLAVAAVQARHSWEAEVQVLTAWSLLPWQQLQPPLVPFELAVTLGGLLDHMLEVACAQAYPQNLGL